MKKTLIVGLCVLLFGCATTGKTEQETEIKDPDVIETIDDVKAGSSSLIKTKWVLSEILDEDGVGDTVDYGTMTLAFPSKKKAAFDTGINLLNCAITINEAESTIFFEQGPMTLKSGDSKTMYLEMFLMESLYSVVSYSMDEETLKFLDSNGNPRLIYVK